MAFKVFSSSVFRFFWRTHAVGIGLDRQMFQVVRPRTRFVFNLTMSTHTGPKENIDEEYSNCARVEKNLNENL